jgi:cyclopropane fatty-acyl-phospholipid synthase-like methyltransferase
MEGIINLENIFEEAEETNDHLIIPYDFENSDIILMLKTRKMHVGVSRSVWKASIVMSNYLQRAYTENDPQLDLKKAQRILELGSGPGLGGLFAASLIKEAETLYLTDICIKSLQLIRDNITDNRDQCNP